MSDHDPNITAEEFICNLHILISHMPDVEERTVMIDYLMDVKDQIQSLEESYKLTPPYEAHRRL